MLPFRGLSGRKQWTPSARRVLCRMKGRFFNFYTKKPGESLLRGCFKIQRVFSLSGSAGAALKSAASFFFHPDCTVGSGFQPDQPPSAGRGLICSMAQAIYSFTAGRELHPTLKNVTFYVVSEAAVAAVYRLLFYHTRKIEAVKNLSAFSIFPCIHIFFRFFFASAVRTVYNGKGNDPKAPVLKGGYSCMKHKKKTFSARHAFPRLFHKAAVVMCASLCLTAYQPASVQAKENLSAASAEAGAERVTYQEGFFYEPLSEAVKERITGISYGEGCIVPYEDLRYLNILYYDFCGDEQVGEIICNKAIAQDLAEIFYELFLAEYPLESVRLVDEYGGDDTLSMEHNNTSCFNFRMVDGTSSLSRHAYGLAVDINPLYNPYVTWPDGKQRVSPAAGAAYADRSLDFPGKIDESDLCYRLFTEHGFTWGGHWKTMKDYQHFQKALPKEE